MKKQIAILAGDGIGPEIMEATVKVLTKVANKFNHSFEFNYALAGGAAFDKYNEHLPSATIDICKKSDAILFGSVGGPITEQDKPKWKNCETNSILALRKTFNFNINLRKTTIYPELSELSPLKNHYLSDGLDVVILRELLGDIYFGEHYMGQKNNLRYASDMAEYDEAQIRSIAEYGFKLAQTRKKNLISVDKANVLSTSKLWRQIVSEVAQNYPDVKYSNMLVDSCAMKLITHPNQFDVILTANLFGDILSDEMSVLSGSLGMMPSASFNSEGFALYEQSGGSAPDIAGQNKANPIAQILSAAMMLSYSFKMDKEATAIENAIKKTITNGYRTLDLTHKHEKDATILGTQEFADKIISYLE